MPKPITRRQLLALGVLAGLTACSREATPIAPTVLAPTVTPPQPAPTAAPATTAPTTALAPTAPASSAAPTAAAPAPTIAADQTQLLVAAMTNAAQLFLAGVDDRQRGQASYSFGDSERLRWHWTTPANFPRNGLPLRDMTPEQQARAQALLAASVSAVGQTQALNIMALQQDLGSDPSLYFVTIFGTPGERVWGWRWEGHHLSRQYTIVENQVAATPFFLGAWPTVSSAGLRAMPREEDAALELANSIGQAAVFQPNTLTRHVTQNQERVAPLDAVGVAYSAMNPAQQQLVLELIQTYLKGMPETVGAAQFERIRAAGFDAIQFGWAGPFELRRPTYYRLQGPTFLIEHDKSRNGGTHIHSVWRDFEQDFGYHLL
ncbi:MAG: hypothetical protein Fur005_11040 [Roseiflexaceae bacterium]